MITTVNVFAAACSTRTADEIYDLFEHGITQPLRDKIYNDYSNNNSAEPAREALNKIGVEYNVAALQAF